MRDCVRVCGAVWGCVRRCWFMLWEVGAVREWVLVCVVGDWGR